MSGQNHSSFQQNETSGSSSRAGHSGDAGHVGYDSPVRCCISFYHHQSYQELAILSFPAADRRVCRVHPRWQCKIRRIEGRDVSCSDPRLLHSLRLPVCARALERVVPVKLTWTLCWPAAALQAAYQLTFAGPTFRELARLAAVFRPLKSKPSLALYLWRERTRVNLARLMCLWPDRLSQARWAGRCGCVNLDVLEQACTNGRSVVLAIVHFGPLILLCHWLRARGLPAAALRVRRTTERCALREIHRSADRAVCWLRYTVCL